MTLKPLPLKLAKEPLVDAIFEIRFTSVLAGSNFLPGLLHSKLEGEKSLERLPVADVPGPIREADPNLMFQPLFRLNWGHFYILIGDRSMAVSCKLPYPGWNEFKSAILRVMPLLQESGLVASVSRYSIRYIDIIEGHDISEQISRINMNVTIGNHRLSKETFNLRVELSKNGYLHAIQIGAPGMVQTTDGSRRDGVVTDIDSIKLDCNLPVTTFLESLKETLDLIHKSNKEIFFDCLTPRTIDYLEPTYE